MVFRVPPALFNTQDPIGGSNLSASVSRVRIGQNQFIVAARCLYHFFVNNMIILCVICRDPLIIESDKIFFTNCGHAFHSHCIDQWLSRSSTCPHCREKVTEKKIHRIYFTYSSEEALSDVPETLQEKIANLKFQILLKDKNIENFTSKNAVLKKQNAELRQEVRNVESEINKKNNIIYDLKDKIRHFNELSSQHKVLKERFFKTKKKLHEYERIIIQKDDKITTLESRFKCQSKFWEREQGKNLHSKYITYRKDKNLFSQSEISELEQLLENSEQNCTIKSSSQRNSNNDSLVTSTPQPKGNIYNQTDTRQKTKNQNDSSSPEWISTGINEEECTLDTTLDECPSSTKKARLFLQSSNDSNEIRTITYDDYDVGNVSSTNKQSEKKKILKVKSF